MSMHIYFAGVENAWAEDFFGRDVMITYIEGKQRKVAEQHLMDYNSLMVDSGAYTAWTKGRKIPGGINGYIEWLAPLMARCNVIYGMTLDVIPGRPPEGEGIPRAIPTQAEVERAVDETLANLDRMVGAGLPKGQIVPVYHELEPEWVLDYYYREGYPVIALGATKSRGKKAVLDWLLPILEKYPANDTRRPVVTYDDGLRQLGGPVKFHLLGMAQSRIIRNVPAFSADSSTWMTYQNYPKGMLKNLHLLRNLPEDFYARWPIARRLLARVDDGRGMTQRERRQLGVDAIESIPRCLPFMPPTRNGQLGLFDHAMRHHPDEVAQERHAFSWVSWADRPHVRPAYLDELRPTDHGLVLPASMCGPCADDLVVAPKARHAFSRSRPLIHELEAL